VREKERESERDRDERLVIHVYQCLHSYLLCVRGREKERRGGGGEGEGGTYLVIQILNDLLQNIGSNLRKLDLSFAFCEAARKHRLDGFTDTGAFTINDELMAFRAEGGRGGREEEGGREVCEGLKHEAGKEGSIDGSKEEERETVRGNRSEAARTTCHVGQGQGPGRGRRGVGGRKRAVLPLSLALLWRARSFTATTTMRRTYLMSLMYLEGSSSIVSSCLSACLAASSAPMTISLVPRWSRLPFVFCCPVVHARAPDTRTAPSCGGGGGVERRGEHV